MSALPGQGMLACSGGCGVTRSKASGVTQWWCRDCVNAGRCPYSGPTPGWNVQTTAAQALGGATGPIQMVEGTTLEDALSAWNGAGHAGHLGVRGTYDWDQRLWNIACGCGAKGSLLDEYIVACRRGSNQIPPPQEKAVCRCPMLTGGAIIHDTSCPEMPGRGR